MYWYCGLCQCTVHTYMHTCVYTWDKYVQGEHVHVHIHLYSISDKESYSEHIIANSETLQMFVDYYKNEVKHWNLESTSSHCHNTVQYTYIYACTAIWSLRLHTATVHIIPFNGGTKGHPIIPCTYYYRNTYSHTWVRTHTYHVNLLLWRWTSSYLLNSTALSLSRAFSLIKKIQCTYLPVCSFS